eukprot:6021747-Pyramimonas_sp.AAC.1
MPKASLALLLSGLPSACWQSTPMQHPRQRGVAPSARAPTIWPRSSVPGPGHGRAHRGEARQL